MIQFKQGTRAQWEAADRNSETIYFLTDSHQIARGDQIYTKSYEVVAARPEVSVAKKDVLYIVTGEKALLTYNGTEFQEAFKEVVDSTVSQDGANAVSGAAVYTFVATEIGKLLGGETGVVVTEVKAGDAVGTLTVTTGEGPSTVTLGGLVKDVEWDSASRKLTFGKTGEAEAVEINLGVDMVVQSGVYDADEQKIKLTLSNGDVVEIPAAALVDIYTSGSAAADTVKVVISSDDNTIKATIAIDGDSIKANAEDGKLYVDFTAVNAAIAEAKGIADKNKEDIAALDTRVKATEAFGDRITANEAQVALNKTATETNKGLIDTLTTTVNGNTDAIGVLNGDVNTPGSVKKQIKDAVDAATASITSAYEADDAATLSSAKEYANGLLAWQNI